MGRKFIVVALAAVVLVAWQPVSRAAGTSLSSWTSSADQKAPAVSLYDQGMQASNGQDYKTALGLFQQALRADPNNPDIINMVAHSQRKLGLTKEALENYDKALALRPHFPEAREYLGEAYLQAALEEVETLRGYGVEGKEQLEDLISAIKEASNSLK